MEVDSPLHFPTKKDALQYWMDMAKEMHQRKDEIEREMQEYQESSQILERELESSYEQSDRKNRDLRQKNLQLSQDYEQLKNRLNEKIKENSTLEKQVQEVKKYNEYLLNYVRNLEKKNDDLERTSRETKASEEDLETKFNVIIEKVALLETELDEKDGLKTAIQHLKDENRDLQQQITVKHRRQSDSQPSRNSSVCGLCRFNSIRQKTCRHSSSPGVVGVRLGSEDEQPQDDCNSSRNSSLLMYVRELEEKVSSLEKTQSRTDWIVPRLTDENLDFQYKPDVSGFVLLEPLFLKPEEHAREITPDREMRDVNTFGPPIAPAEPEVRLRSTPPLRRAINKLRPHSGKPMTAENAASKRPNSTPHHRASRLMEERLKKVKDEEKRQQSLASFLKRLRYDWRRKKH